MKSAYTQFKTRETPQSQPIPGSTQVQNNAGGFAWGVDDWTRLDRFLILGSEGGTYYVGEAKLTRRNAEAVIRCVKADGARVVNRIVEISDTGRAPKNDPALFALAICAGEGNKATRKLAFNSLPRVARTGTHLFHFIEFTQQFRGWGRGMRDGISGWYSYMNPDRLAYQLVKYRQRDGWTHRDLFRKAHPTTESEEHAALYKWVIDGEVNDSLPHIIQAYHRAQEAESAKQIVQLIVDHRIPREAIPTQFLNDRDVWAAMLEHSMPLTAMIRNLPKMTDLKLLNSMGTETKTVIERLTDQTYLAKSRVHPLSILVALSTYQGGQGIRGKLSWKPVTKIIDALDKAFYLSFGNVEPSGKNILLALDVSGSMGLGNIAGLPGITPRVGSAAMALITANVEPNYEIVGFSTQLIPLTISPRQRLDDAVKQVSRIPFGGTDCAQPMIYALKNGINADGFVVYTDNETWAGSSIHPAQALNLYREKTGIPARSVVVGMTATGFSIADPNDSGMLDVVGFDTATPQVISDFVGS